MPINIWMQNTTLDNLSGGWVPATDMTQVFSGTLDFPIGINEIMVDLIEPFIYEGQNVIVFVERVMDTQYYSTGDTFYYTDTQYTDRCIWAQSDSDDYDPYNPPTTINYLSSNPNTMMFINISGLGSLEGYAYNQVTNEPLEGVLIDLIEQRVHTFTDASGHYNFPGLFEGTYEAHATLFAHSEDIETVVIVADETTNQDFYLTPATDVEVTGRVVGSDYPDIGLGGAEVTLSGMGVHEGITDPDGYFLIEDVFSSNTYQITVVAEGYEVLVGEAVIGETNTDLGDIIVNEVAFPPMGVVATQNPEDTVVDVIWEAPDPEASNFWDFENDNGEFTANMGWAWGTDTMSGAYSGINVWGTTLNAQYPNSVNYQLVTPEISIPSDDAVLTFWHWMDIETTFDGGNVKISTDGGTSWTLITPVGGYPGTAYGLNSEECFNGHGMVWTLATFEIGAYQGEDVMFMFHFGSDSSVTYQGWYIDDVFVGMPGREVAGSDNPNFHPVVSLAPQNPLRIIEGYNVYSLLLEDEGNEDLWTLVGEGVMETFYSDISWVNNPYGLYEYAVKAVYTNEVLSDAAFSNWVGKDMYATLEVTLTTNVGDIPAGAEITLEATEPDPDGNYPEYSGITDENGECTIIGIWKSNYDLTALYPGFSTLIDNIDILEDVVTYTGMVYEEANPPSGVLAVVNPEDTECDLTWEAPGAYPPYEIIYDDDVAENATAWYDPGNERSVWFTAQGGPCMVTGGSMHIYDGTWPAGNILTPFTACVWAYDDATGLPGELLGSVEVTPTDYYWVPFTFDTPIPVDGTEFFLGYAQGGVYPDCAGIGIDETTPTMGRSYEHYVTGGTAWTISTYQDFMLRAIVQGPSGRELTVSYENPVADFSNITPHKGTIDKYAHNLPVGTQSVGEAKYMPIHNTNPFAVQSGINATRDRELMGYNVFIGEYGDEANWEMWNQVNTAIIPDILYTDVDWVNLIDGIVYTYAVRSVYTNNNMSGPAFSNWVGKNMYATLEVTLTTNIGDIPVGAEVSLEATEPDPDGNYPEYMAVTDENGECVITNIWRGNYNLEAELTNFATLEDNIEIMESVVIYEGMITEMIYPAHDVYVEENPSGNAEITWHSPSGALNTFYDFEADDGEFVGDAGWEWANGSNAGNAWSGDNCWSAWPNTQYPNSANSSLYTPVIGIPSDETQLIFYQWYDIENYWDGGNVKISLDEGAIWTIIEPIGGYPGTAVGLNGEVCYNGTSGGWIMAAFDLSMYDGEDVMFRFHFGSDSSVTYSGWDIDDVYIGEPETRGCSVPLFSAIVENEFSKDSGTLNRLERMEGYSIFRGFADDEANFESWTLIASSLQDTMYEDTSWDQIGVEGDYEYCVRVEYLGDVLSEPAFSNMIYNEGIAILYGDVTADGVVDAYDAANLLQYTVGMDPVGSPLPWTWQMIAGDVSGDQDVDAYDAALVLQYSVGIIDIFPVEAREIHVHPAAELSIVQVDTELIISAQGELYSFLIELNIDLTGREISFNSDQALTCVNGSKMALASALPVNGEICQISLDSQNLIGSEISGTINEIDFTVNIEELPEVTTLNAIYPNPFNPVTNIQFSLSQTENVKITVYNLKGQKIAVILNEEMAAGNHSVSWNAQNTPSGIYFLNFNTDTANNTQKVVLLK